MGEIRSDGPISREEMIELFGEEMPIEAVRLLFESPGDKTAADLRRELREIAANRSPPPQQGRELIERALRTKIRWPWFVRFPGCEVWIVNPDGRELAAELERLYADNARLRERLSAISTAIPLGPSDAISTWRHLALGLQKVAADAAVLNDTGKVGE